MTFVDSIKTCLAKYADFSGRATRSEFWWFQLFYILVYIGLAIVGGVLSNATNSPSLMIVVLLPILGLLLPMLAANVRRLHDTDRSGWWLLISLVPLVGLVLIYFLVIAGTPGDNRFGTPPAN
ncbi:MAG: DUF805 domain-containing protein [Methylotenera sp.]